jgi:DNA-binding NarL/FixJ family response regulator
MIRVLIVDKQSEVRRGLSMRLGIEADMTSVGETGDIEEALSLARAFEPDVIVVDIGRRDLDSIDSISHLREAAPAAAIIVLTLCSDERTRAWAQEAGARAFLEKRGGAADLLQAIRQLGAAPTCASDPVTSGALAKRRPSVG